MLRGIQCQCYQRITNISQKIIQAENAENPRGLYDCFGGRKLLVDILAMFGL